VLVRVQIPVASLFIWRYAMLIELSVKELKMKRKEIWLFNIKRMGNRLFRLIDFENSPRGVDDEVITKLMILQKDLAILINNVTRAHFGKSKMTDL
jgi:hypothetical protein